MLQHPVAFFAACRSAELFGSTMFQGQVNGCNAILSACAVAHWPLAWTAYGVATAFHETAHSMAPRAEIGKGAGHPYGVVDETGKAPYGRGYVQLTHRDNYVRADHLLGLGGRLASDYDVAKVPEIAAKILVRGMAEGWFTGKSLKTYVPADRPGDYEDFRSARRIINGTDRADLIAGYALVFQQALTAGGWDNSKN